MVASAHRCAACSSSPFRSPRSRSPRPRREAAPLPARTARRSPTASSRSAPTTRRTRRGSAAPKGSKWKICDPTSGKGFESRGRLRGREAARVPEREGRVDVHAVQQVVRAGQEGLRLRHQPDLVHARARQGRRLQRLVLRREPGGRRPARARRSRSAKSLAGLQELKLGAQLGTTSYDCDHERRSSRPASRRSTTRTTGACPR